MSRCVAAWLVALCCLAAPAFAVEIEVTTTEDGADPNPGDGSCDDGLGRCTLRAAIQTANALAGADLVILQPGVFRLTVKRDPALPDDETGDLDVTSEITVSGSGSVVPCEDRVDCSRIDAKGAKDRAFDVSPLGDLRIDSLSVANGKASKTDFDPSPPGEVSGGCVRAAGALEVEAVVIEGCSSPDDGGCIGLVDGASALISDTFLTDCRAKDGGGGIAADAATLEVERVTLSASKAGGAGGGVAATDSVADLQNVTLSGNKAKRGGGVSAEGTAEVFINSSTLAGNAAKEGASILGDSDEPVLIGNSLVTSKKGNDCAGLGDSLGGNLDGGVSCSFTGFGDQSNVDPLLGPLADHGGEVPTHELLENSPAIDSALDLTCEATDARGEARFEIPSVGTPDTECDVGAFEFIPTF